MTTISAKIIADSIADNAPRLTTLQLRYPRWIHAEFMTHRVFSRNASSSRAVPVKRLIQDVLDDPAVPLVWGKNQKGMQATEENHARVPVYGWGGGGDRSRENAWLLAMKNAVNASRGFDEAGYHKQLVNRLLEPFSHINVVVTATEWDNFFALRDHPAAEPHMRMLAIAMRNAMTSSAPRHLNAGEWHLPYVGDVQEFDSMLIKASVARCARVSYLTHEGVPSTYEQDGKLCDDLIASVPRHASPAEHEAAVLLDEAFASPIGMQGPAYMGADNLHGNLAFGWGQFRKLIENGWHLTGSNF